FNLFRRFALSKSLRNCNANTIRMAVFKIAGKIVNKSRYKYFKLCSNYVHKEEFIETFINIQQLYVQLNE
ncbi:MAG: transposase, partial [Oscillospiraceae bacterium]|nr:transposase [Oscillospiraceae bacterium]